MEEIAFVRNVISEEFGNLLLVLEEGVVEGRSTLLKDRSAPLNEKGNGTVLLSRSAETLPTSRRAAKLASCSSDSSTSTSRSFLTASKSR